jgi:hypothetical protein
MDGQIREDKMGGACGRYGEKKNIHTDLVGRPKVKKPHRRPRSRHEDNIKVNFIETGWEDVS